MLLFGIISHLILATIAIEINNEDRDGHASRKILGSSVVTSVSVITNSGNGKPSHFSDVLGHPVPKPSFASQIASPINLLNPDRYEFYTFNDDGELVKRLMTLEEIQGIIAGGDGENSGYNSELDQQYINAENEVSDIVENVQNVLQKEIEAHKNASNVTITLDTPDVSGTWDVILPAIFGTTGNSISVNDLIHKVSNQPVSSTTIKQEINSVTGYSNILNKTQDHFIELSPLTTQTPESTTQTEKTSTAIKFSVNNILPTTQTNNIISTTNNAVFITEKSTIAEVKSVITSSIPVLSTTESHFIESINADLIDDILTERSTTQINDATQIKTDGGEILDITTQKLIVEPIIPTTEINNNEELKIFTLETKIPTSTKMNTTPSIIIKPTQITTLEPIIRTTTLMPLNELIKTFYSHTIMNMTTEIPKNYTRIKEKLPTTTENPVESSEILRNNPPIISQELVEKIRNELKLISTTKTPINNIFENKFSMVNNLNKITQPVTDKLPTTQSVKIITTPTTINLKDRFTNPINITKEDIKNVTTMVKLSTTTMPLSIINLNDRFGPISGSHKITNEMVTEKLYTTKTVPKRNYTEIPNNFEGTTSNKVAQITEPVTDKLSIKYKPGINLTELIFSSTKIPNNNLDKFNISVTKPDKIIEKIEPVIDTLSMKTEPVKKQNITEMQFSTIRIPINNIIIPPIQQIKEPIIDKLSTIDINNAINNINLNNKFNYVITTKPDIIVKPINKPHITLKPVNEPDNVLKPINKPDIILKPINKPDVLKPEIILKPENILKPINEADSILKPVNKPDIILKPINKPDILKPENILKPINETDSALKPANKPDTILKPINKPDVLKPEIKLKPENILKPINETNSVLKPINKPDIILKPINKPDLVKPEIILKPETILKPLNEADSILKPVNKPDITLKPINKPDLLKPENILKPETLVKPLNESDSILKPINKSDNILKPINKPDILKPEIILKPTNEPDSVLKPINKPDIILKPINKPEVLKPEIILKPENILKPINEEDSVLKLINKPDIILKPINKSEVLKPEIILKPDIILKPVNKPDIILNQVNKPDIVLNPLNKPDADKISFKTETVQKLENQLINKATDGNTLHNKLNNSSTMKQDTVLKNLTKENQFTKVPTDDTMQNKFNNSGTISTLKQQIIKPLIDELSIDVLLNPEVVGNVTTNFINKINKTVLSVIKNPIRNLTVTVTEKVETPTTSILGTKNIFEYTTDMTTAENVTLSTFESTDSLKTQDLITTSWKEIYSSSSQNTVPIKTTVNIPTEILITNIPEFTTKRINKVELTTEKYVAVNVSELLINNIKNQTIKKQADTKNITNIVLVSENSTKIISTTVLPTIHEQSVERIKNKNQNTTLRPLIVDPITVKTQISLDKRKPDQKITTAIKIANLKENINKQTTENSIVSTNQMIINVSDPYRKAEDSWKLVATVTPPISAGNSKLKVTKPTENPIQFYQQTSKIDLSVQGNFGVPVLSEDMFIFSKLYNELALKFWSVLSSDYISSERSVIFSPFAVISMLGMIFLGARGGTSNEMNDLLKLDDIVSFNPHLKMKEITESITSRRSTAAIVRELYSDNTKGKILDFYKERVRQFYGGIVEEVDFRIINDVVRRRTNLMINKQTRGYMQQYLGDTNFVLKGPLAALSMNIFQADCLKASTKGRDGELYFIVLPSLRQRRLVPIPAAVWRTGFIAGYDPELDATAVSLGTMNQIISTVFVIPGQQGHAAPGDVLLRLEARLLNTTYMPEVWTQLLKSMLPRPNLEVQLPRFSHKSVLNITNTLKKLGLNEMFNPKKADLRGLTGSTHNLLYFSDIMQVNEFSVCGETQQMHMEIYPSSNDSVYHNEQLRSFKYFEETHDKFSNLPLPLRPRQARVPEIARLKFDRPFLYFVRHNPTGLILYMGRFNPKLLP